jgi:hypothetical protein
MIITFCPKLLRYGCVRYFLSSFLSRNRISFPFLYSLLEQYIWAWILVSSVICIESCVVYLPRLCLIAYTLLLYFEIQSQLNTFLSSFPSFSFITQNIVPRSITKYLCSFANVAVQWFVLLPLRCQFLSGLDKSLITYYIFLYKTNITRKSRIF